MFTRAVPITIIGLLLSVSGSLHAALSLHQAETIAVSEDPMLAGFHQQAKAFEEQSVADGQLSDPKLKFGLVNYPTDDFDRTKLPLTQIQLGVRQQFPAGDTLKHKSQRTGYMGNVKQAKALMHELTIRRDLRKAWLETYYWIQAGIVVRESQELFKQLINITHSRYTVGGQNQQDIIRAELELEMLKDKQTNITAMETKSRAELARWIGEDRAAGALSDELPVFDWRPDYETIKTQLKEHPAIQMEVTKVKAYKEGVAIAEQAYKPKWMVDVTYGIRGGEEGNGSNRDDVASAMLIVDIPIFTEKRQDKRLAASQHRVSAAMLDRDTRLLELKRMLDKTHADWTYLDERVQRYKKSLVPQALANAEAALTAYQSDRGDFTMLMRARITELNTRLQAVRLKVNQTKAQAGLMYLAGEKQ